MYGMQPERRVLRGREAEPREGTVPTTGQQPGSGSQRLREKSHAPMWEVWNRVLYPKYSDEGIHTGGRRGAWCQSSSILRGGPLLNAGAQV